MFNDEDVSSDGSESRIRQLLDTSHHNQYPSGGDARCGRSGQTQGGRGGNRVARSGKPRLSDQNPRYDSRSSLNSYFDKVLNFFNFEDIEPCSLDEVSNRDYIKSKIIYRGSEQGRNPRRGSGDQYLTPRNAITNSDKEPMSSQNVSYQSTSQGQQVRSRDQDMIISARDRTNVDYSDTKSMKSKSSSIQRNQLQVPVTDIFKTVLRNYNGVATLTQVKKEFGHFFSNDQDTISWFKKKGKSYFRVFENKQSPSKTKFGVYMKGSRTCIRYSTEGGCSVDKCDFLHYCRQHLVNNCHASSCRFSHDIASDHNKRVIGKYAPSQIHQNLTDPELFKVVRCGAIQVCDAYNNRGCSMENEGTCRHLHICKAFVSNTCEYSEVMCKQSHNFDTCKSTIRSFGMESMSHSMLKKVVLVKTPAVEYCNNPTFISKKVSKRKRPKWKEGRRNMFNVNVANDNANNLNGTSWTDDDTADMDSKDNLSVRTDDTTNTDDNNAGASSRVYNETRKNQVFDKFLKYFDGQIDVGVLGCFPELSLPDDVSAFFKNYPEDFILLEVDQRNSDSLSNTHDKAITYKRCMQICGEYAACKAHSKQCNQIHLCREFVEGFCAKKNACNLSHDLLDDYNHDIVGNANLLSYNKHYLLTLVRCSSPSICTVCDINGNCENDLLGICPYIHVCAKFIRDKCDKTRCPYGHDIKSKHIRTSLSRYFDPIPSLSVLKDAILIPRREKESRPSSPIGRIIHDTDADICEEHVRKECAQGEDCTKHHCDMPYLWQYLKGSVWMDLDQGELIEKHYSHPQKLLVHVHIDGEQCEGHLEEMMLLADETKHFYPMRRLTTASDVTGQAQRSYLTHWVWYWQERDSMWQPYSSDDGSPYQDIIEASYLNRKNLSRMRFERGRYDYEIDFSTLEITQTNLDTGNVRSVRRRPKFVSLADVLVGEMHAAPILHYDSTDLPDHWSPMDTTIRHDTSLIKIELPSTHHEYTTVLMKFNLYMSIETQYRVKSIHRVQNPDLWRVYASKTKDMKRRLGDFEALNELNLFHGTDSETVEGICNQNFDHRLHGKNATAYGCGTYFARRASYSNRYTSKGCIRHMFLARVLIGRSAKGSSTFKRPPPVNPAKPHGALYDSCVDDTGSPSIYVIFHSDQCYPEYLIEYEDLNAVSSESGARPKVRPSLSPPSTAISVRGSRYSPTLRPKLRQSLTSSSNSSNLMPIYGGYTQVHRPPTPPLKQSKTTTPSKDYNNHSSSSSPNKTITSGVLKSTSTSVPAISNAGARLASLGSQYSAFTRAATDTKPVTSISPIAVASSTRNSTMAASTFSPISSNSDHDSLSYQHLPTASASSLRRPPSVPEYLVLSTEVPIGTDWRTTSTLPGTDLRTTSTLLTTDLRTTSTLPSTDLRTTNILPDSDDKEIASAVGKVDLVLQQAMLDEYRALARAKTEREDREKRNNEAQEQLKLGREIERLNESIDRMLREKGFKKVEGEGPFSWKREAQVKAKKKNDGCTLQ